MDKQRIKKPALRFAGQAAARAAQFVGSERSRMVLDGLRRFALCAVLARGVTVGGYAPFGLAMATAMMAHGAGFSAIAGVFCGAMLMGGAANGGVYAAAALLALCVMSACAGLRVMQRKWFAPMVAALSGASCTFVLLPIGRGLRASDILTFLLAQGITFAACRIYCTALEPCEEQNDWKRPTVLLAVTASVLLSLADLELLHLLSPARVAALLIAVSAAWLGGPTAGAAVGVGFGAAMDLAAGQGALFTCGYGLCAMIAGLFREQGKFWFALCAVAGGLCGAMLGVDHVLFIPLVLELLCAVAVFAVLPQPVWRVMRQMLLPETLVGKQALPAVRQTAGRCAAEAAQAFYELYLSMLNGVNEGKNAGDHNVRAVFDRAGDRVCKNCVLCSQCWQRDYVTTLSALNDVTQPMLRRGRAELSDFPQHFASRCVRLPELMRAINNGLFALRERQSLRRQQEENQSLLARQYAGVTDILRQLGAQASAGESAQPMMERQVRRYAAAFGWVDHACVVRDAQGRLVVEIYGAELDGIVRQGDGFSAGLSALLGVGLSAPELVGEGENVHLELHERAPFRAVVGIGRQKKEDAAVSGDSGSYFMTDNGTACLLLADGMGSGAAAARDSRLLVSSLERFLRAGVSVADALGAVSPALRLRADGTRFATLDALTVDLFSGRAESLKCGAAPSYLRIGGKWTVLRGTALPIGLEEADKPGQAVPLRLGHGDLCVLLSDGVSDGQNDEWVRELLLQHAGDSPKDLAARLVNEAGGRSHDDDRTAIVLRLEKANCK